MNILQVQWPKELTEENASGIVDIDGWWEGVEKKILEGVAFRSAVSVADEGHKISPWIPPACRAYTVLNAEVHKGKPTAYSYFKSRLCIILCYRGK